MVMKGVVTNENDGGTLQKFQILYLVFNFLFLSV